MGVLELWSTNFTLTSVIIMGICYSRPLKIFGGRTGLVVTSVKNSSDGAHNEKEQRTITKESPTVKQDESPIYHISSTVSRPLSQMTEEEQLGIIQKLETIEKM